MNYYIQGDAANADKIKAAFEKLGYEPYCWTFETEFYFTVDCTKTVQIVSSSSKLINIIKTHPDYKELELSVEPKFKVGDWIVRGEGFVYEPSLITEIRDYYICELLNGERVTYTLNDVHKNFHLWAIEDAKDGDIIGFNDCTHNDGSYIDWVGIYKHQSKDFVNHQHLFHCVATNKNTFRIGGSWRVFAAYPATKEQRDLLFAKMKKAGYEWDADKKELHKIKPHYDISNFKPFQKVLVRDGDDTKWRCNWFSHYSGDGGVYRFVTTKCGYAQCIPFEGNEHLLGTTDMPSEEFINW